MKKKFHKTSRSHSKKGAKFMKKAFLKKKKTLLASFRNGHLKKHF